MQAQRSNLLNLPNLFRSRFPAFAFIFPLRSKDIGSIGARLSANDEIFAIFAQHFSNFAVNMYEKVFPSKRFKHTLEFLRKHISTSETILDLGVENPFSAIMKEDGFSVSNTTGEDLDENQNTLRNSNATVVTAFEIFEHLLNPYTILKEIKSEKLFISIPMRLWFSPAYRSKTDLWDRHYHEFEDWQLDWLLEKTGWKIIARDKWTNPVKKIGWRPLLRKFTNRYYIVYAEKVK